MATDVIVIGAGVEGTSTAYHLAREGLSVILIEQFPWPNSRGSSCGHSRALRRNYVSNHWYYSQLADKARFRWREIEKDSGLDIYKEIGVISFALNPQNMDDAEQSMKASNLSYTPLDMAEVHQNYPMFAFPRSARAIFEKDAGILLADNAMKAFMTLFLRHGGRLHDREKVVSVEPGDLVRVRTDRALYQARKLVITAGPWSKQLLASLGLNLPLKAKRIKVMYWKEKVPGMFSFGKIPNFRIIDGIRGTLVYCIVSMEYQGLVKVCLHDGPETDPEMRDTEHKDTVVEDIAKFIRKYLPDLEDKPSIVENCFYTCTPDHDYILDRHPRWNNIVIGAGFSGHGFKLAPVVGDILSDLVRDRQPKTDMKPFSIQRFGNTAKL